MSRGTTAEELLQLAVEELNQLSREASFSTSASALSVAQAWPLFATQARYLLRVCVVFPSSRDPVQQAAARAARAEPYEVRPHVGDPRLLRAADLLAAAGDLVQPWARMASGQDRRAASVAAARVYLLGAQLTTQATVGDLRCMDTAAAAAKSARDAASVIHGVGERVGGHGLSQPCTDRRPRPTPGDLVGLFDVAVYDWRVAASDAAKRPDVSSEDLRGAALGAGRILAVTRALHHAHFHHTPPAVTHMDHRLRRAGVGLNAVATGWTKLSTGIAAARALIEASSRLQNSIALLACNGPDWASVPDIRNRVDVSRATDTSRHAVEQVRLVIAEHAGVAKTLATHGRIFCRASRSIDSHELPNVLRRQGWVVATNWETGQLTARYDGVLRVLGLTTPLIDMTGPRAAPVATPAALTTTAGSARRRRMTP